MDIWRGEGVSDRYQESFLNPTSKKLKLNYTKTCLRMFMQILAWSEMILEIVRPIAKLFCREVLHPNYARELKALELLCAQVHLKVFMTPIKHTSESLFHSWPYLF